MRLTARHYAIAWFEALSESKPAQWSEISAKFLREIQVRGKLSWLAQIVGLMQEMEHEAQGETLVTVTTAHELDKNLLEKSVQDLLALDKAQINQIIDPTQLGGMRVETKDRQWNLTLANQLTQLEKSLLQ